VLRAFGNSVTLATPLGVTVALLGRCRLRWGPGGLIMAEGYQLQVPGAPAFVIGNVLLTTEADWDEYQRRDIRVFDHEERHSWQWLVCGPAFLPAYLLCCGWSWLRTGNPGSANLFEMLAGLRSGGYRKLPRRSLVAGVRAAAGTISQRMAPRSAGPSEPAAAASAAAATS